MRNYELTIILDGKATAARKKSVTQKIEKVVTDAKGKVGKVKDWGLRDLAYKIKKSLTGTFLIFPLELKSESVKALNEKLRLDEEIIRYLLVKKEK
jgi:small subunit ribosomal protein S6